MQSYYKIIINKQNFENLFNKTLENYRNFSES